MKGSIWKGKGALFLLLLLFLVTMSACSPRNPPGREGSQAVSASPSSSESSAPVEEKEDPQPSTISLVAVGDNLIHDAIYNQASRRAGGDGYDFSFAYEQVAPLIAGHDIAFYNQETPLASAIAPLSSYPMFNSPTQLGDHMLSLGFNVVTQANNHMLDQGEAGLVATMDYWDTTDALMIGPYRNEEAMNQPATITKNGITIAFVATTYGTNGLSLPGGSELRYILDTDLEEIQRQIQMARQSADFVVVAPHWGVENTFEPSSQQLERPSRWPTGEPISSLGCILTPSSRWNGSPPRTGGKRWCSTPWGTLSPPCTGPTTSPPCWPIWKLPKIRPPGKPPSPRRRFCRWSPILTAVSPM